MMESLCPGWLEMTQRLVPPFNMCACFYQPSRPARRVKILSGKVDITDTASALRWPVMMRSQIGKPPRRR
jgi:hypothetical protein